MIETNVTMTILKVSSEDKILATLQDGEFLTAKSVHKPTTDETVWQEFDSLEQAKEFYEITDEIEETEE